MYALMLAIHALVSIVMSMWMGDNLHYFVVRLVAMLSLGTIWFMIFNY